MILQDKVYVIDEEKIAAIVKLPKSYAGAVDGGLDAGNIFVSTGYGAAKKGFSVEIVEEDVEGEIVGGWIGESVGKKETVETEVVISPEKKALLRRLTISTLLMALFLVFVFAVFSFSGYPNFVFALLASMIFIFIVIYNL
jgi:hypothetical protein